MNLKIIFNVNSHLLQILFIEIQIKLENLYHYKSQLYIHIFNMQYLTKATSNYRGTNPALAKVLIGASGICAFLGVYSLYKSQSVYSDIEYRKSQLSKPIYKLSKQQMSNPPWNKQNLHEWLYRRVEVTGRPIHRLNCLIPRRVEGKDGFQCVLPLVGKQNDQGKQQEGIIFSRGFIPYAYKTIGSRYRIEDSTKQTFVGFVSTLPELEEGGFLTGNAYQPGRLVYNYANLDDFVRTSGFQNKKQASVALVERLYEVGDLNERRGKRYSNDCDHALEYPYYKTQSGALQLPVMPWDYKNRAKGYLATSLISLVVGASIF